MTAPGADTVTFLFTDVEGSTRLAKGLGDAPWADLLADHRRVVRQAISENGGREVDTQGDAFFVVFARATDAANAALATQRALEAQPWPEDARVRVRIGLHTGEALARDGGYVGQEVHRASRICDAGHGGQIVLSQAAAELVRPSLPDETTLADLGPHRLKDLEGPERLFQLTARGLASEFPRLRSLAAPHNLPAERTSFIGRENEIRTLSDLLGHHRLVTLTGTGGAGKTRVALRLGTEALAEFADGVFFVDLTAVAAGGDVPAAVAGAVGLVLTGSDATQQVVSYLADKTVLVILDNCEHVVDSCADFAAEVLAAHGDSTLLATSREALDVEGERVAILPALESGSADAPGVRLFVERATAVCPDLSVTPDVRKTIVDICTRLDGMPLAIELAAARSTVLNPAALLAGLDDRFNVLSSGGRRRRRRTLEATLDWSWDLLEPDEQRAFRSLGVFVDGFDLDAAAAVMGATPSETVDLVEALVAKSLVIRADAGDTVRFRLLESMKAYAERRLEEADDVIRARSAHFEHFRRIAGVYGLAAVADLRVGVQLSHDVSNVSAAFAFAASEERWEAAAELIAGAVSAYEYVRRTIEGLALLERAIEHLGGRDELRRDYLRVQSLQMLGSIDDYARAQQRAIELAESDVRHLRSMAFTYHGWAASYSGPNRGARLMEAAEQALAEARQEEPGRNTEIAAEYLHIYRAGYLLTRFDYERALEDGRVAKAIAERTDLHWGLPNEVMMVSLCLLLLGDARQALENLEENQDVTPRFERFSEVDFVRLLARLELGQMDATAEIRRIAVRGMARSYAHEANDCVVLLAGLALAEDDRETATHLVLDSGTGGGPACIMADAFAARLDLGEERRDRIVEAIRSRDPANNTGRAANALERELVRRGWLTEG